MLPVGGLGRVVVWGASRFGVANKLRNLTNRQCITLGWLRHELSAMHASQRETERSGLASFKYHLHPASAAQGIQGSRHGFVSAPKVSLYEWLTFVSRSNLLTMAEGNGDSETIDAWQLARVVSSLTRRTHTPQKESLKQGHFLEKHNIFKLLFFTTDK